MHEMSTYDGITVRTNSLHHQMANPYDMNPKDYRILAWSSKRISDRYLGAKDKSVMLPFHFKEIEAIYFPNIKAIGVQYHPEMMWREGASAKDREPVMTWTQKTFLRFFHDKL
jgi:hypothetical protein